MDDPLAPEFEVECPLAPDLSRLAPGLRARLRTTPDGRTLVLRGEASSEEIQALRECHPGELSWQMAVDRLGALARPHGTASSSRFPSTPWGLLLAGLDRHTNEEWLRFMTLYRRPIGKSISKALHWLGRRESGTASELADEFFSWFFEKGIHANLVRVGKGGKVNRFRGYLRRCITTFLREGTRGPVARDLEDVADADVDAVGRAVDEELCRDAVEEELAHLKGADVALWRSLTYDFRRLTLEDAGRRLGVSVATAHRLRMKARAAFRDGLIRRRLQSGVVTEQEARDEWEELIPVMSRVIEEVAAGFADE